MNKFRSGTVGYIMKRLDMAIKKRELWANLGKHRRSNQEGAEIVN